MSDQARASTGAFGDDPKLAPRYMNIPTFMRTPLLRSADEADIVMIGVPYDHAVTNRPGARQGPREVRNASTMMRSVHHVSGINPHALLRIGDLGDVPLPHLFDDAGVVGDIEGFYQDEAAAGAMPLSIGGDHSITYPILKALGRERPLGLVHIDAHTDTWDQFLNTRFSHGAPFRRAVETGVLDPKRTIQIG
jgi:guanidinopropionase